MLLHCYQLSGYSLRGIHIGWKNLNIKSIQYITIIPTTDYTNRVEYNPKSLWFVVVYF